MSNDKVLALRGKRAVWAPVPKDTGPIDPARLPEGYPYKEGVTIEWDGNAEGLPNIQETYFKVSDLVPDDLTGWKVGLSGPSPIDGGTLLSYGVTNGIGLYYCALVDTVVVLVAYEGNTNGLEPGVYFVKLDNDYVSKISNETIHPMSEEFLPAGVGGGGAFYVRITVNDSGEVVSFDKTYEEIAAAVEAKQAISGDVYTEGTGSYLGLTLSVLDSNYALFLSQSGILGGTTGSLARYLWLISSDGVCVKVAVD